MRLFIHLHDKLKQIRTQLEQIWSNIVNIFRSGKKHNAFHPFTIYFLIAVIAIISLYKITDDRELKKLLIYALLSLMVFGCIVYTFFAIFKPDRLQTETFLLADKKLNMLRQKGSDIIIDQVDLTIPPRKIEGGQDE